MLGTKVVYLSYSGADRVHVESLIEALQNSGCEVFDPQRSVGSSDGIATKGVDRADVIVVLWSEHAKRSAAVQRELRLAQDWDKKLVMVLLDDTKPPRLLVVGQNAIHAYTQSSWIASVIEKVWPLAAEPWRDEGQGGSVRRPEDKPFSELAPPIFAGTETEWAPDSSRPGAILFNLSDRMRVGRVDRVEVRQGDANAAVAKLTDGVRGRGVSRSDEKLEIAPQMRVGLTADPIDFTIRALSTEDQFVRPKQIACWDFEVTPLRGGQRRLRLLASLRVKLDGKDEVVDLPSLEREVHVAVAPLRAAGQFCSKNWQWIAGGVAIPLVIWAAMNTSPAVDAIAHVRAWFSSAPAGQSTSAAGK